MDEGIDLADLFEFPENGVIDPFPVKTPQRVKRVRKCSYCSEEGHNRRTCPRRPKCGMCQKIGHDRRTCPDQVRRSVYAKPGYKPRNSARRQNHNRNDQRFQQIFNHERDVERRVNKTSRFQNITSLVSKTLPAVKFLFVFGLILTSGYLVLNALLLVFEEVWAFLEYIWDGIVAIYYFLVAVGDFLFSILEFIYEVIELLVWIVIAIVAIVVWLIVSILAYAGELLAWIF